MARLPYLDADDLPEDQRNLLSRPINLNRALAHNPGALRTFGRMGQWIRHDGNLDPRLRELAIVQVGYSTASPYEYSHHVKIGREFGLSDDDLRAVGANTAGESTHLGDIELLVLRAAREMTDDLAVSGETWAGLEEHLDEADLVELTLVIAFYNAVVRILGTIEIDVEDSYVQYLDEFPLP